MKADKSPLQAAQNIHMVGIGGSGMSALAIVLKDMGKNITGSDAQKSEVVRYLTEQGIPVTMTNSSSAANASGQSPQATLPLNTQILLYSQAVSLEDAQRKLAEQQGIPTLSYPQAVGLVTQQKRTISVCGTHGKTTTTAMLAAAFLAAGKDPTVIVGAAGKSRQGKGDHLILEACEYQQSFLNYHPSVIVVTNIEWDHMDAFKTFETYKQAFHDFFNCLLLSGNASSSHASKIGPTIIANGDDPEVVKLCDEFQQEKPSVKIVLFGHATERHFQVKEGKVWEGGQDKGELKLQVPGNHNKLNALAAYSAAAVEGLDSQKTLEALQEYTGAARRFEILGKIGDCVVVDDYAHHPTEIQATLSAAREKFGKDASILCVFQPHQYSRTAQLLPQFAAAFTDADEVIISDIYAARDTAEDKASVSAEKLAQAINEQTDKTLFAAFGGGKAATIKTVHEKAPNFDAILFLGAGTITQYAHEAVETASE